MGKKLKVNFVELHKVGEKLDSKADEFENERKRMETLVSDIPNAWKGEDSTKLVNTFNNYLESLKSETNYLREWSNFFKSASSMYGADYNEQQKNVSDAIDSLEDDQSE